MSIQRVRTAAGEAQLKQLIQDHVERTGEDPNGYRALESVWMQRCRLAHVGLRSSCTANASNAMMVNTFGMLTCCLAHAVASICWPMCLDSAGSQHCRSI